MRRSAEGDDAGAAAETDSYIGLGANLGERRATIEAAIERIAGLPRTRVVACSSLYETAPVDAGGGDYLNGVVRIATRLGATALLRELRAIETAFGRERPYTNAPRTLDLDLLVHGETRLSTAELVVPHPRLAQRAFVLRPLAEIAPDLVVPGVGPVARLLPAVAGQRVARLDR